MNNLWFLYLFYAAMPPVWFNLLCVIRWPSGRRDRQVEAQRTCRQVASQLLFTKNLIHCQLPAYWHTNRCLDTHWHLCMFVFLHLWKCLVLQRQTSRLHEYFSSSLNPKSILIEFKVESSLKERQWATFHHFAKSFCIFHTLKASNSVWFPLN